MEQELGNSGNNLAIPERNLLKGWNTLLAQHIAKWIEHDRPHITVTTYNQYVNMLNNHIAPYFNPRGITVGNVTAGDLEDYYRAKVAEGLSPNTVIKHHAIIRSAL